MVLVTADSSDVGINLCTCAYCILSVCCAHHWLLGTLCEEEFVKEVDEWPHRCSFSLLTLQISQLHFRLGDEAVRTNCLSHSTVNSCTFCSQGAFFPSFIFTEHFLWFLSSMTAFYHSTVYSREVKVACFLSSLHPDENLIELKWVCDCFKDLTLWNESISLKSPGNSIPILSLFIG